MITAALILNLLLVISSKFNPKQNIINITYYSTAHLNILTSIISLLLFYIDNFLSPCLEVLVETNYILLTIMYFILLSFVAILNYSCVIYPRIYETLERKRSFLKIFKISTLVTILLINIAIFCAIIFLGCKRDIYYDMLPIRKIFKYGTVIFLCLVYSYLLLFFWKKRTNSTEEIEEKVKNCFVSLFVTSIYYVFNIPLTLLLHHKLYLLAYESIVFLFLFSWMLLVPLVYIALIPEFKDAFQETLSVIRRKLVNFRI